MPDPWGFGAQSGYYTDRETGYIYCTFRYYDPETGRWLSRDPIGYAGGLNLYRYCSGNPVMLTDPLGLYDFDEHARQTGLVFKGYGKALNGAFNPFEIAKGAANIASVAGGCGFGAAGNMLAQGIVHSFTAWMTTDDPEEFGESLGTVLITGADVLAPHASCLVKCFVEGTPVWMADGTTKAIEEVKEGDFVLSYDTVTGKVVSSRVLATSARESDVGTVSVSVDSGHGKRDVIECTPEHPLFVPGKGWTQAGDLGIGTSIVTRAGPNAGKSGIGAAGTARVVSVVRHASRRVTVCNMTVEDTHTYFVGTANGGLWVHNTYTGLKRGPKTGGAGPHNITINRRIAEIKAANPDWTHTGGGSGTVARTETMIDTTGGFKPKRRTDITFERPDGSLYFEQVGKQMKGKNTLGVPVPREVKAISDIEGATGITPVFTPYN